MTDVLLNVTRNPLARRVVRTLGIPIPLPEPLAREAGPWTAMPLEGSKVAVGAAPGGQLLASVALTLARAGTGAIVDGSDLLASFTEAGEAYGRPPRALAVDERVDALVYDASGITTVDGLRAVHRFFHPRIAGLARSGRVVVLGRTGEQGEAAAAQSALEGFVRSAAKEIGKRGATANLVRVERGAEARLEGVLRFLLEKRSAFVSAQPLVVSKSARDIGAPAFVRPLDGKVALVTGAARGIGAAIARRLAGEGARVICVDRPEEASAASALARELGGTALPLDIAASDAAESLIAFLRHRGLDILVHNAGITRDKTLARMDEERWNQTLTINLGAVIDTTEALLEAKVLHDGGRIIGLASIAGIAGNVGQTNYAASKAGVIGYVRTLGERLAPRGVTVNAIAPGFIETRMTAAVPALIREAGRRLSALGQGGLPDDVAQAVAFLASPGAQGITASTLRVCGGALIGA